MRTPALLAILDGVGLSDQTEGNALAQADAPYLHQLFAGHTYPVCALAASGRDVGLPDGQMGNSEVGHLNIGAGRIVHQELTKIDIAIEDGTLYQNAVLLDAFESAKSAGTTVHFMGLLSDGGVHSMQYHLEALIAMAAHNGNIRIRIHAFLDGRDVSPTSGAGYIRQLQEFCSAMTGEHLGLDLRIGSISGRYYAMDRDNRWERIEQAWRTLVVPFEPDVNTLFANEDPLRLLSDSYKEGITDEFVKPLALGDDGIADGDTVVFFNFRPDRARELTRAFIDPDFESYGFNRPVQPKVKYVCMTQYDPSFAQEFSAGVAFDKSFPQNTLSDYFASLGLRQLHIAETEKYAHVTFFLNGGIEKPKPGEQRILIPSPKVATYDLCPEMSANEVTAALVDAINQSKADVYIVNYANGDMVGHTGSLNAAIKAIEAVDRGLRQVVAALQEQGGVALITADHGNAEQMFTKTGEVWTAHSISPVPLVLVDSNYAENNFALDNSKPARLADVAPTLLDLMDLPIPREFTGRSLLLR